jgi:hypothetical protein
VVSINVYPGWHVGEIDRISEFPDSIVDRLDEIGQGDKPLILSEIGGFL